MIFFCGFIYHIHLNFLFTVRKNAGVAKFSFTVIQTRKILVEVKRSIVGVH
jgi:hypothetical protein